MRCREEAEDESNDDSPPNIHGGKVVRGGHRRQAQRLDARAILMAVSRSSALPIVGLIPPVLTKPFHRDGWVYEEKYDGWRMIA